MTGSANRKSLRQLNWYSRKVDSGIDVLVHLCQFVQAEAVHFRQIQLGKTADVTCSRQP